MAVVVVAALAVGHAAPDATAAAPAVVGSAGLEAPGVDSAFGFGGAVRLTPSEGPRVEGAVRGLVRLSDGTLVAGGFVGRYGYVVRVAADGKRLLARSAAVDRVTSILRLDDGRLAVGNSERVSVFDRPLIGTPPQNRAFSIPVSGVTPRAMLNTPAGIVLAGVDSGSSGHAVLARLRADGSRDGSFDANAATVPLPAGFSRYNAITSDTHGRLIAAGQSADHRALVARFLADGHPDPTFGQSGVLETAFDRDRPAAAYAVTSTKNASGIARIVVGGSSDRTTTPLVREMAVLALTETGAPDVSFGSAGARVISVGSSTGVQSLVVSPRREIVASAARAGRSAMVVRMTPDGTLDRTLGGAGVVCADRAEYGTSDPTVPMLVLPDRRTIVAVDSGITDDADGSSEYPVDWVLIAFEARSSTAIACPELLERTGNVVISLAQAQRAALRVSVERVHEDIDHYDRSGYPLTTSKRIGTLHFARRAPGIQNYRWNQRIAGTLVKPGSAASGNYYRFTLQLTDPRGRTIGAPRRLLGLFGN